MSNELSARRLRLNWFCLEPAGFVAFMLLRKAIELLFLAAAMVDDNKKKEEISNPNSEI